MQLDDFYKDGEFLRRWHLDGRGQAVCPFTGVPVAEIDKDDREAILAANAAVRARIEAVEAYEGAQRVRAGEQPVRDETYHDEDGEERTRWSAAYHAWFEAGKVIDEASADTVELVELRTDPPDELEPIEDDFPHLTALTAA